jgi:hypothetical protein
MVMQRHEREPNQPRRKLKVEKQTLRALSASDLQIAVAGCVVPSGVCQTHRV